MDKDIREDLIAKNNALERSVSKFEEGGVEYLSLPYGTDAQLMDLRPIFEGLKELIDKSSHQYFISTDGFGNVTKYDKVGIKGELKGYFKQYDEPSTYTYGGLFLQYDPSESLD